MYRKIFVMITLLLMGSVYGVNATLGNMTISVGNANERCGFSFLREAKAYDGRIYVLDYYFPFLIVYNYELEEVRRINLERQLLRDLAISPTGDIYVLHSSGLWRINFDAPSPFPDEVWNESYGVFYVEYGGKLYGASRKLVSYFKPGEGWKQKRYEDVESIYDLAYIPPYLYGLGEGMLYKFDENISFLGEEEFINATGIAGYKDLLIAWAKGKVYFINTTSNESVEVNISVDARDGSIIDGKIIAFNETCVFVMDINMSVKEEKPFVNETNETETYTANESVEERGEKEERGEIGSILMDESSKRIAIVALLLVILVLLAFILHELRKAKRRRKGKYKYRGRRKR